MSLIRVLSFIFLSHAPVNYTSKNPSTLHKRHALSQNKKIKLKTKTQFFTTEMKTQHYKLPVKAQAPSNWELH